MPVWLSFAFSPQSCLLICRSNNLCRTGPATYFLCLGDFGQRSVPSIRHEALGRGARAFRLACVGKRPESSRKAAPVVLERDNAGNRVITLPNAGLYRLPEFLLTILGVLLIGLGLHATRLSAPWRYARRSAEGKVCCTSGDRGDRQTYASLGAVRRVSVPRRIVASVAGSVSATDPSGERTLRGKLIKVGKEAAHFEMHEPVADALAVLLATVIVVPIMKHLKTSPILGFLLAGVVMGPNGLKIVKEIGASKALAELGVVFFLFEMGLELSVARLKSLFKDVFGLGLAQFVVTGVALGFACASAGLDVRAAFVVGGALALSSSAFVLQLLNERGEIGTRFGRGAFGILLFQDLAVVPLLVVVPLLGASGGGMSLAAALGVAAAKGLIALVSIYFAGHFLFDPVFNATAGAKSPEAFVATILATVLGMSALTEGFGLSDTLGAFLAGTLLAETRYRHQIEADILPFRGLLLGLFFMTVGFGIDMRLLVGNLRVVILLILGVLALKAGVITALARLSGFSFANSQRTGLILAQGGEFAFVVLGLAQRSGVLDPALTQLLNLVIALSMACTPVLFDLGLRIASAIEQRRGLIGTRSEDVSAASDYVLVAGFGRVGQAVCDMLSARFIPWVAFDTSPTRVIEARKKGLPVFFGDACRPDVLRTAGAGKARAIVVTVRDPNAAYRAVTAIRQEFPEKPVFARARDERHRKMLSLAGATAIVPEILESSLLLGGAVLHAFNVPPEEISRLIEDARKRAVSEFGLEMFGESASTKMGMWRYPAGGAQRQKTNGNMTAAAAAAIAASNAQSSVTDGTGVTPETEPDMNGQQKSRPGSDTQSRDDSGATAELDHHDSSTDVDMSDEELEIDEGDVIPESAIRMPGPIASSSSATIRHEDEYPEYPPYRLDEDAAKKGNGGETVRDAGNP
jgi:CPA2 family monovalent cation:H+ antiporter-2